MRPQPAAPDSKAHGYPKKAVSAWPDVSFGTLVRPGHFPRLLGVDAWTTSKFERTDPRFPARVHKNGKPFGINVQLTRYRDVLRAEGRA